MKYSQTLPSQNESTMEWGYSEEIPPLSENQVQQTKILDPLIQERNQVDELFKNRFVDRFLICKKIFNILKKVNLLIEERMQNQEFPTDVMMVMIFEFAVKYCSICFSEISKNIIVFINRDLKGKYLSLLRRSSLKKIIEEMSKNNPKNSEKYEKRQAEYQKIWDQFFPSGTNNKGGPKEKDLEALKHKLENMCSKLKIYRDKVAVHFGDIVEKEALPVFLWSELENIILQIQEFLQNFHFLLTHMNFECDELDGIGFTSEENTVKSYINGIFQKFDL